MYAYLALTLVGYVVGFLTNLATSRITRTRAPVVWPDLLIPHDDPDYPFIVYSLRSRYGRRFERDSNV